MERQNQQKWVHVFTASGEPEAALIASLLESEGIEVRVEQESVGKIYSISVNGLGAAKIFVPEGSVELATALIESKEVR